MDRTTWVEVSGEALTRNFQSLARHAHVPVCAVVKANAYGHGLVDTAGTFAEAGARMLGVTRIEEARALRDAGLDRRVLVMTPVPDPGEAVALGCGIVVGDREAIASLPADAEVHLKIDTGMGRLGVRPAEALDAARAIGERANLTGVWTHFADAAGASGLRQLARFREVVEALRSHGIAFTAHASNSSATLALPEARFDMVRVGTLLYGQHPVGARAPWKLHETLRWYARVASVRTLPAGAPVGYGSEWRAPREIRVATIPVGYADGFGVDPNARTPSLQRDARRAASSLLGRTRRVVHFDGREVPVIGRVAMQATTVDVTRLPDVTAGSVARLPARRMLISPAIERVYPDA